MPAPFTAIDHVQLAMPRGEESAARAFYAGVLGMTELPKPDELAARGGCWFTSGNVQLHLGVEDDFRPARKAHPALRCSDLAALAGRLRDGGIAVREDTAIPGTAQAFVDDPFGNRIELIGPTETLRR
jgi:catechol 2,3-dioxygenase-like lactoylglutathione lyase family enzyme